MYTQLQLRGSSRPPVTLTTLDRMREEGERVAALTCYDASFAAISEEAGVDMLLIGDSLGMVIQGRESTLSVTLEETEYHVRCVAAGSRTALVIADMPFASFQESPRQAFRSAARMMAAGAQMVKLEGGAPMVGTESEAVTRFATAAGIASMRTSAAPASSSAFASATRRSAESSLRPCTR